MENYEQERREDEADILTNERLMVIIPECCKEGWDSCPHVIRKQKPAKKNIGL